MALPKLNDSPKYDIVIPSTNEKVRYRPYLVKEEKVLMMAMESQDTKAILNAVVDTIAACVDSNIDKNKLAIFDVEYMFTQIRAKSVGETSKISMKCSECKVNNEISVDVGAIGIVVPDVNKIIQVTPIIAVEMKWPSYSDMIRLDKLDSKSMTANAFKLIGKSIEAIVTEEERILFDDESKEDTTRFLESLTADQFTKIMDFVNAIPKLQKDIEFDCTKCGHHNKLVVQGIGDFF